MSELVFLRPYWLLALIPAAYLWWRIKRQQGQNSAWKNWIDPAFHPYLLAQKTSKSTTSNWAMTGLAMAWLSAIIALSGPSWHSVQIPAQKTNSASVIVLDLSLSMYADDIEPNRLTRVQFKLTDLLKQNPDLRAGLVAYSGSAHIISPISDDNTTLLNLLPHLNPLIMPSYGSDAVAGFKLANELLRSAQINQGHIIWITDDIEATQVDVIKNLIKQNTLSLSILAVGSQTGGAVKIPEYGLLKDPQGRLVQAPLPLADLQSFSQQTNAKLERLQLNNQDLENLKPRYLAEQTQKEDESKQLSQALDYGVYLLGLVLIFAAFSARRGWVLSMAMITLLPGLVVSPPSFAENEQPSQTAADKPEIKLSDRWREVYLSGNQRGYQAWLDQNFVAAEREFDDPAWQGSALYRQAKFAEAAEAFKKVQTPEGHYNLGNALAKSGDLEAAKQAYQQALEMNPSLEQAQHNLELIDDLLKQQDQQTQPNQAGSEQDQPSSSNEDSSQTETDPAQNNDESDQANPDSDQTQSTQTQSTQTESQMEQENAPASAEESESSTDQSLEEQQQAAQPTPEETESDSGQDAGKTQGLENPAESESNPEANQTERERDQANQAWLNQIRDEPGLFLRRKFDYQYQQNPPDDPQQNERKIW